MLVTIAVIGAFGVGNTDIAILFIGVLEKGQGRIGCGFFTERQVTIDVLCVRYCDPAGKGAVVDFEQRRFDDILPRTLFTGDGMCSAVVIDEHVHVAFRLWFCPFFEIAELNAVSARIMGTGDAWCFSGVLTV